MDYALTAVAGVAASAANEAVREEAATSYRGQVNRLRLTRHAWNVAVLAVLLCQPAKSLLAINWPGGDTYAAPSFIDFFRLVAVHDFLAKFVTILLKICFLLPAADAVTSSCDMGNAFRLLERTSQLYRYFAPIPLCFFQCLFLKENISRVVGLVWRVLFYEQNGRWRLLRKSCGRWWEALQCLVERRKIIGRSATENEAGQGDCPICYDSFTAPIVLACSHVFCDACVRKWFEKEHACPLCRSRTPGLAWTDGATLSDLVYR